MRDVFLRGIDSIFAEGEDDFRRHLDHQGLGADGLGSAREALRSMVDTLITLNRATLDEEVPMAVRAMLPSLVSYFLAEEDLIPSRPGQLVLGLLDNAYLVHRIAMELDGQARGIEADTAQRHVSFLEKVLPEEVRARLEEVATDTVTSAMSQAELLGL